MLLPSSLSARQFARISSRGFARPAALATLTAGIAGLAIGPRMLRTTPAEPASASVVMASGDTVTVYGPRQFQAPVGGGGVVTNYGERFSLARTPLKKYTLRGTNGAPDGSARVSGGQVKFNGLTVVSPQDIAAGGPGWSPVVSVAVSNTLYVSLNGSPQPSYVTIQLLQSRNGNVLVFGPERFARSTGPTVTFTRTFSDKHGTGVPTEFWVLNGNVDGTQRLARDTITITGTPLGFTRIAWDIVPPPPSRTLYGY